jgi:hypothetical protein
MNVVCNPADASGRDTVKFGARSLVAENTMNIERAKGVGHGGIIFWHFEY